MPTFNVKIQKADGSTEHLIVESKQPLNAKNFLRRRRLKPIEVQISKSNTSSGTEPREQDHIATCELKTLQKQPLKLLPLAKLQHDESCVVVANACSNLNQHENKIIQ